MNGLPPTRSELRIVGHQCFSTWALPEYQLSSHPKAVRSHQQTIMSHHSTVRSDINSVMSGTESVSSLQMTIRRRTKLLRSHSKRLLSNQNSPMTHSKSPRMHSQPPRAIEKGESHHCFSSLRRSSAVGVSTPNHTASLRTPKSGTSRTVRHVEPSHPRPSEGAYRRTPEKLECNNFPSLN